MSADEIEFFISDELPPEELGKQEEMGGEPRRRRPRQFELGAVVAVLLLGATAALATVAPFQRVYTIRQGGAGIRLAAQGADGWGRYRTGSAGPPAGIHDIRYGIPLVACAGAFALLAMALVATSGWKRERQRVRTATVVIALAVTGVLAGVTVSIWLHIQSLFDTLNAQLNDFGSGQPKIETGIGACVWLSLAGVVAGLLAAGALWYSAQAESGSEEDPGKLA